jgi:hypothetical protein
MFYRLVFAFLLLLGISSAARAVEINSDTGCDNSSAWMVQTGWTAASSSKCVGSDVRSMKMLMQMTSAIKKNHRYRITFTVSNYSGTGSVRAFVGITMPSAPAGSWITAASLTPIPDRFTLSEGLDIGGENYGPGDLDGPGNSAEVGGSMRVWCTHANFGLVDPILNPGTAGVGHIHEFVGNTSVNEHSDYTSLRTKGATSCQDSRDPYYAARPVNPTAYWWPAVMDGLGHVIRESQTLVYYKGPSDPGLNYSGAIVPDSQYECTEGSGAYALTHPIDGSVCPNIPHGMKYIFGYNKANGQGRPDVFTDTATGDNGSSGITSGTKGAINFRCIGNPADNNYSGTPPDVTADYDTLADLMASGLCHIGDQVHVALGAPWCWDGVHIDSPDHRAHMAYGYLPTAHVGSIKCPDTHPYHLPQMSVQNYYPVDQAFMDGKWRLSIDEMVDGLPAGAGAHMDYFWAWSPEASNLWFTRCYTAHNHCTHELGNGTHMKTPVSYDGFTSFCNGCAKPRPDRYVSTTEYGMSHDYTANGTYTVDLTSPADGVFGFMGLKGFNGSLDNISVTELPARTHA